MKKKWINKRNIKKWRHPSGWLVTRDSNSKGWRTNAASTILTQYPNRPTQIPTVPNQCHQIDYFWWNHINFEEEWFVKPHKFHWEEEWPSDLRVNLLYSSSWHLIAIQGAVEPTYTRHDLLLTLLIQTITYSVVLLQKSIFSNNSHKRHTIACPLGRVMVCLCRFNLWVTFCPSLQ